MLNYIQMSDLWQFQMEMPDCPEKELLHTVLFEYNQYTQIGSVKDCQNMKEWLSLSINDIRVKFNSFVKEMQQEVEYIREDVEKARYNKLIDNGRRKGPEVKLCSECGFWKEIHSTAKGKCELKSMSMGEDFFAYRSRRACSNFVPVVKQNE